MRACVRACVHACVRACVRVCVCVCVRVFVCVPRLRFSVFPQLGASQPRIVNVLY